MVPTTSVTFTMELQEWDITFRALGEQPYRIVNPIIKKLSMQLDKAQEATLPTASDRALAESFLTVKPPSANGAAKPVAVTG
jgi:hypothetical protein